MLLFFASACWLAVVCHCLPLVTSFELNTYANNMDDFVVVSGGFFFFALIATSIRFFFIEILPFYLFDCDTMATSKITQLRVEIICEPNVWQMVKVFSQKKTLVIHLFLTFASRENGPSVCESMCKFGGGEGGGRGRE